METVRKFLPLNIALMANPVNWVIVVLMITIAGYAVAAIFPQAAKPEN